MSPVSREQILEAVDEGESRIVGFLSQLIQINSVTGHEGPIQDLIQRTLAGIGLGIDVFEPEPSRLEDLPGYLVPERSYEGRPNVVAIWEGTGGGKSLLLNGHVDTVPLGPEAKWSDGALSGAIRDGRIWGRGASDMKGGLAAMTMAVTFLKELGFRPAGDVILQYVVDEERTGLGTLACVERGYSADAGICCETSDLQIMPACIGRMWFTIRIEGKPAGISSRWDGVDAIQKGMMVTQAIEDLEEDRIRSLTHPLYSENRGALPCAVTMFQAGTFPSIPADHAELRGSMGLMPFEEPEQVKRELERHIAEFTKDDEWLVAHPPEVSTEGGYVASGAEIPVDHPIVRQLEDCYVKADGTEARVAGRMGAADTRFLIESGRTPTVIFGPGITSEMHALNESVPLASLRLATKVLALTVRHWCQ